MGIIVCSIGILGDVTEIEQYNKNLMSCLLLSDSLYHLFCTASCADGYAEIVLTFSFDVKSVFQTSFSFLSIHAMDKQHGFSSFL